MTSTGGLTSRPLQNTGRGLSAMPRNAPPGHALSPGPRRRTSRPANIYLASALIATGVYAGLLIVRFTTSDPLFGVRDLGIVPATFVIALVGQHWARRKKAG